MNKNFYLVDLTHEPGIHNFFYVNYQINQNAFCTH